MSGRGVALLWTAVLLAAGSLVGCTLIEPANDETAAPAAVIRADMQARLAEAWQDHQMALDLWDRIILGEPISCVEAIPVPQPLVLRERDRLAHAQVVAIAAEFNAAVQGLRDAADLWTIECADERTYVPLTMAREGRAAAVSAGRSLEAAQVLFDAWSQNDSS